MANNGHDIYTKVRTVNGDKFIRDLRIGDKLYNENDELVKVLDIGPEEAGGFKLLEMSTFGAKKHKFQLRLTDNQTIYLRACASDPVARHYIRQKGDDNDKDLPTEINPYIMNNKERDEENDDNGEKKLVELIKRIKEKKGDGDDYIIEEPKEECVNICTDKHINKPNDVRAIKEINITGRGDVPEGQFILTWFSRCDVNIDITSKPNIPPHVYEKLRNLQLLQFVERTKGQLHNHTSKCKGKLFRCIQRNFPNLEMAQYLQHLLLSDEYRHIIDENVVLNGHGFSISITDFQNDYCFRHYKNINLKLSRCSLRYIPSKNPRTPDEMPIHPYLLGLFLGDGTTQSRCIYNSSLEIRDWLRKYVEYLNKKYDTNVLYLKEYIQSKKGSPVSNTKYTSNVDVYSFHISSLDLNWNPINSGFNQLGFGKDKSVGVPEIYKQADIETRLLVIAGLLDSDGSLDRSKNLYMFKQSGTQKHFHEHIVDDMRKLCHSVGIHTSEISKGVRPSEISKCGYVIWFAISISEGCEKLLPYLQVGYKRDLDMKKKRLNSNLKTFSITKIPTENFKKITVEGHLFQHYTRLILHD